MLWNVSFGTKKHKAEPVASKRLFADWELNAVHRWERHKALLGLPRSLYVSWGKEPLRPQLESLTPFLEEFFCPQPCLVSAFYTMPQSICFPWKSSNNLLGLAALLILAPHGKHLPEPGLCVLVCLLDPLFLLTVMMLIFVCSVWSLLIVYNKLLPLVIKSIIRFHCSKCNLDTTFLVEFSSSYSKWMEFIIF